MTLVSFVDFYDAKYRVRIKNAQFHDRHFNYAASNLGLHCLPKYHF